LELPTARITKAWAISELFQKNFTCKISPTEGLVVTRNNTKYLVSVDLIIVGIGY
jgi:hypothetical protein